MPKLEPLDMEKYEIVDESQSNQNTNSPKNPDSSVDQYNLNPSNSTPLKPTINAGEDAEKVRLAGFDQDKTWNPQKAYLESSMPFNSKNWDGKGNDIATARDKVLNEDTQRNAVLDTLQRLFLDGLADGGTGGTMEESVADAYLAIEEVYDAMPMINVGESDESIDRAVIKARIDELGQVHHDDKNNWVFTFAGVKPGENGIYLSDRIDTLKQQLEGKEQ